MAVSERLATRTVSYNAGPSTPLLDDIVASSSKTNTPLIDQIAKRMDDVANDARARRALQTQLRRELRAIGVIARRGLRLTPHPLARAISIGLDVYDLLGAIEGLPPEGGTIPKGWNLVQSCGQSGPAMYQNTNLSDNPTACVAGWAGRANLNPPSGTDPVGTPIANSQRGLRLSTGKPNEGEASVVFPAVTATVSRWNRPANQGVTYAPSFIEPIQPMHNPNVMRAMPSVPGDPSQTPREQYEREAAAVPRPRPRNPYEKKTWTQGRPGGGGTRYVSPRTYPGPGVAEGKHGGTRKLAVALFGALDVVSEYSEIVDAFYEALPNDVRNRWERKLGFHWVKYKGKWVKMPPKNLERGLLDNAGQYGIDGADWKAQALFHNIAKVDVSSAVENIIKNRLEDKVLGTLQRARPKNTVSALNQSDQFVGEWLNGFIDEMVNFDRIGL